MPAQVLPMSPHVCYPCPRSTQWLYARRPQAHGGRQARSDPAASMSNLRLRAPGVAIRPYKIYPHVAQTPLRTGPIWD